MRSASRSPSTRSTAARELTASGRAPRRAGGPGRPRPRPARARPRPRRASAGSRRARSPSGAARRRAAPSAPAACAGPGPPARSRRRCAGAVSPMRRRAASRASLSGSCCVSSASIEPPCDGAKPRSSAYARVGDDHHPRATHYGESDGHLAPACARRDGSAAARAPALRAQPREPHARPARRAARCRRARASRSARSRSTCSSCACRSTSSSATPICRSCASCTTSRPGAWPACRRARYVLEIGPGEAARIGLREGMACASTRRSETPARAARAVTHGTRA